MVERGQRYFPDLETLCVLICCLSFGRRESTEYVDVDTDGATAVDVIDAGNASRRPRSLTQQSVASFSMFCSVDSEQSLPRTAPLATPEQDMSLLENLPVDRSFIRESLDDVNIDVLDVEEVVMQVSL